MLERGVRIILVEGLLQDCYRFPFIPQTTMPALPTACLWVPCFLELCGDVEPLRNAARPAVYDAVTCVESCRFEGNLDMGNSPGAVEYRNQGPRAACWEESACPFLAPSLILKDVLSVPFVPTFVPHATGESTAIGDVLHEGLAILDASNPSLNLVMVPMPANELIVVWRVRYADSDRLGRVSPKDLAAVTHEELVPDIHGATYSPPVELGQVLGCFLRGRRTGQTHPQKRTQEEKRGR